MVSISKTNSSPAEKAKQRDTMSYLVIILRRYLYAEKLRFKFQEKHNVIAFGRLTFLICSTVSGNAP